MDLKRTALIEKPNAEPVELPAIELSATEAAILGQYASWLSKERLMGKLTCPACDAEVEVYVDNTKIGIVCAHRMLYYEGPVPCVETIHPESTGHGLTLLGPVPDRPISTTDAHLLRQYKKFLLAHGLKESLWCLRCEDEGREVGLRAYVTNSDIGFLCRCANRTHKGLVH